MKPKILELNILDRPLRVKLNMDENSYHSAVNEISKLAHKYQQNYLSLSEGDIYRMVLFHLSFQSTYLKESSIICRGANIEIEQQVFLVENKNCDNLPDLKPTETAYFAEYFKSFPVDSTGKASFFLNIFHRIIPMKIVESEKDRYSASHWLIDKVSDFYQQEYPSCDFYSLTALLLLHFAIENRKISQLQGVMLDNANLTIDFHESEFGRGLRKVPIHPKNVDEAFEIVLNTNDIIIESDDVNKHFEDDLGLSFFTIYENANELSLSMINSYQNRIFQGRRFADATYKLIVMRRNTNSTFFDLQFSVLLDFVEILAQKSNSIWGCTCETFEDEKVAITVLFR